MLLIAIFIAGYLAIVFEHQLKVTKSASALFTGVLCWTVHILGGTTAENPRATILSALNHQLSGIAQILFFLLGAMTIVELIDAHDGFDLITARIQATNRRVLLVTIALLAFFLSAILDNLTTSIVMLALIRKLMDDESDRVQFAGVVIIASNAGGAWSPIGDVTTTMLWIAGAVTPGAVIKRLFLPSLVSIIVPGLWIGWRMKGNVTRAGNRDEDDELASWQKEALQRAVSAALALTAAAAATASADSSPTLTDSAPRLSATGTSDPIVLSVTLPTRAASIGKSLIALDFRARTGTAVLSITRPASSTAGGAGGAGAAKKQRPTYPAPGDALLAGDILELSAPTQDALTRGLNTLARDQSKKTPAKERPLVLFAGIAVFLLVPIFKTVTHLPPVMGILLGLAILWTLTELLHKQKNDKGILSVAGALQRVDSPSILFFLGILLAIGALESDGVLHGLAGSLDHAVGNVNAITLLIGLASSIVDNVPLVAAAQGMYPLTTYPPDHTFWIFLAYCAGTGGSILIIGSAAGIAVMGIQRVTFGWYLKRLSLPVLLGYLAGALTFLGMELL